jgi:preprotein translocase subunit SecE
MIQKLTVFFNEMTAELKKVTWPTMDELRESTVVVVVATILVTLFIGVVDIILNRIFRFVIEIAT